jgi:hypothetical protein
MPDMRIQLKTRPILGTSNRRRITTGMDGVRPAWHSTAVNSTSNIMIEREKNYGSRAQSHITPWGREY